jgi:hypothetical protein
MTDRKQKNGWRLWGPPPFHFLLIGALLFCANGWLVARSGARDRDAIDITAAQVKGARLEWMRTHKAVPTPEEERVLIDWMVEEEILFRESLRIGLDRSSPVVRRRLLQIAGFVDLEPNASEEDLLQEARALGLDRDDPVIRRHVVGIMRSLYQRTEVSQGPTEDEVRAYVEERPDRFMMPERVAFVHVYLSEDRRGASLSQDAAQLLERLNAESALPEGAAGQGDVFLRGHSFPLQTQKQVVRVFGTRFAEAVMAVGPGVWSGPIVSPYGLHLVWVQEKTGEQLPEFAAVRGRARQELLVLRGEEKLRERLVEIRGNYEIRVEGRPATGDDNGS